LIFVVLEQITEQKLTLMKKLYLLVGLLFIANLTWSQNSEDQTSFSIKAAYTVVQHLEPQIYGQHMGGQQMSAKGGTLSGMETMNGLSFKAHYFFPNNLGLYLDFVGANSSNSVEYQNDNEPFIQYQTSADFINPAIGVASRFSLAESAANLVIGSNVGYFRYNYSYSQTSNGLGQ
jgi:hypothetical protein